MDLLEKFSEILATENQEQSAMIATKYQNNWARLVKKEVLNNFKPKLVAGVDVAYSEKGDQVFAAVVVLDFETLSVQELAVAHDKPSFPYIPGLFSFRELPSLLLARP